MDQQEIVQFYQRQYDFEHQRKETLFARLNLPLGLFTLMVGALTYLLNNFPRSGSLFTLSCFYVTLFLFAATIAVAFWLLLCCFRVHKFAYISTLEEIQKYMDEVEKFNQSYPDQQLDVSQVWYEFLRRQYQECSTFNIRELEKKERVLCANDEHSLSRSVPVDTFSRSVLLSQNHGRQGSHKSTNHKRAGDRSYEREKSTSAGFVRDLTSHR